MSMMMLRGVRVSGRAPLPSSFGLLSNSFRTSTITQLNTTTKPYTIAQRYQTQPPPLPTREENNANKSANENLSIFSGGFASRLKRLWKGEQGTKPAEPLKVEGEEQKTAEEKEEEEKDDKKLMENIEKGKFDFEDYHREISRLVKMAKVKGAYDSVKGKVSSVLGKGSEAPTQMQELITDFDRQIALLNVMTTEEKKNPDAFYDHAFKSKLAIVEKAGQTVFDFNQLLQKYEASRLVYMVLHEVKRRGKEIPKETDAILPFVHANVHLLSDKDKLRMKKLMENIEKEKFDFDDYHREISRLVKMAKVKGAYDSVKGKVSSVLGKGSEAPTQMQELITDFDRQIALLNVMTTEEKKNPDAFYDHAFKSKLAIVEKAGQTVFDFNQLLQKYEASRLVYMVLHEVKRRGKEIPKETDAILPFVHANVHLLSDKDKLRMKKLQGKPGKRRR